MIFMNYFDSHCHLQLADFDGDREAVLGRMREQKAACVLVMGAAAEKKQDFEAAVRFYREALAMEPICNDVWYFIHNNLGYSADKCRSSLPTLY